MYRWSLAVFRLVIALLFVFISIGWTSSAYGNAPLTVTAEEYSLWDGTRLFVAEGNVTVHFREALITADVMHYDTDAAYAVFSGNVVYVDDGRELTGDKLEYDLNSGKAVFDGMDAVLYSDGVDGPMFVRGDRVMSLPGQVRIERGRLTTCECDGGTPAYHFAARELEIYPGDRMVVRGMTFYEHGVPLLYLPYMVLSLKENVSHFDVPQIGYGTTTGWYVKLTYNYVLDSGLYGALLLDYFQKLGPGGGVRHTYKDDETGRGTLFLYGVRNAVGGADGTLEWERHWTAPSWSTDVTVGYDVAMGSDGVERHELRSAGTLQHRDEQGTMRAEADYRGVVGMDPMERVDVSGELRRRLGDGWSLRLDGDWFDERTEYGQRRWLGYTGELQRVVDAYTFTMRVERQVNPDLKDEEIEEEPSWRHVSRLPEMTLRLRRMAGIDVQLGAVRLQEEPSGASAWRGEGEAALATRTWRLGRTASANFSGAVRGLSYSTGHQQLTVRSRTGVNVRLAPPLSFSAQYNYVDAWGDTPFYFDRVSAAEKLSGRLNWRSSALTASLGTSYDLLAQRWDKVTANATVRATPKLTLRATGTYDLYEQTVERVIGTVDWRPAPDWTVRVGGRFDAKNQEWERVDADIEAALGGGWKAGLTAIYDVTNMSFSRHHMYISHDADCREVQLRYDQAKGEVWLEYHIAAFPSSRVAVGAGDDNKLMFEADALADLL